jgi:uncharacterized protein (DUF3084 family)
MKLSFPRSALLSLAILFSTTAPAQDHIAPLSAVRQDLQRTASQRATNLADVERLLARSEARQELAKARLNPEQAQKAISLLNDEELARLAARARTAEQDVKGGLLIGLLAIIGAITVILIVAALVA